MSIQMLNADNTRKTLPVQEGLFGFNEPTFLEQSLDLISHLDSRLPVVHLFKEGFLASASKEDMEMFCLDRSKYCGR